MYTIIHATVNYFTNQMYILYYIISYNNHCMMENIIRQQF